MPLYCSSVLLTLLPPPPPPPPTDGGPPSFTRVPFGIYPTRVNLCVNLKCLCTSIYTNVVQIHPFFFYLPRFFAIALLFQLFASRQQSKSANINASVHLWPLIKKTQFCHLETLDIMQIFRSQDFTHHLKTAKTEMQRRTGTYLKFHKLVKLALQFTKRIFIFILRLIKFTFLFSSCQRQS